MSEDNSHLSRRQLREQARLVEEARAAAEQEERAAAEAARVEAARRTAESEGEGESAAPAGRRRRARLNHAADGPVDVPYIRTSPQYFAPVENDGDAPITRRTLRLRANHQGGPGAKEASQEEEPIADASGTGAKTPTADAAASVTDPITNSMSLEQISAAREALAAQVLNQAAGMEAVRREDPNALSLADIQQHQVLAEKARAIEAQLQAQAEADKAEAERAEAERAEAEKNKAQRVDAERAAAEAARAETQNESAPQASNKHETSTAREAAKAQRSAPSDVDNLAMVTPLEFEKVPGVDRPVMKRPATSHVPVVTNSQQVSTRRRTSRSPLTGRLKRVDAEQLLQASPVEARDAYGLDPLGASERQPISRTKFYVAQAVLLVLGLGTLATGIFLILQSMNR